MKNEHTPPVHRYLSMDAIGEQPMGAELGKDAAAAAHAYETIIDRLNAPKPMKTKMRAILGIKRPTSRFTDANLRMVTNRYFATARALRQVTRHASAPEIHFAEYAAKRTSVADCEMVDLQALKASFDRQIGRECKSYVARFTVADLDWPHAWRARVIMIGPAVTAAGKRKHGKARHDPTPAAWERVEASTPGRSMESAIQVSAAFWAPPHLITKAGKIPKLGSDEGTALLNAFALRASLPLDRSCFGRGMGKAIVKSLRDQIRAFSGGYDIFKQAPLQPEAIPAFLADLARITDGALSKLPAVRTL